MVEIEKLEVLRAMTYIGLFGYLGMSDLNDASSLKSALQIENYDVLTDKNKTGKQMADTLGKKMSTIRTYRGMLTSYGLADKFEFTIENSAKKRVEKFLDRKPSYFKEVKNGVKGFHSEALLGNRKVTSIGPRGRKLYFLIGQEEFAKKEFKKNGMKGENKILDAITEPMTLADIKNARISLNRVNALEKKGKLLRIRRTHWSSPLEDGPKFVFLIENDEIYRHGQEPCIANTIIEKIQALGVLRRGEKSSLSAAVQKFPPSISDAVRQSYAYYYRPRD